MAARAADAETIAQLRAEMYLSTKCLRKAADDQARLDREINQLAGERDAALRAFSEEKKIVSRIWQQLGSPSYAELAGRSIHDVIDELRAKNP